MFRQGMREQDPHALRDLRIALAAALGRSPFAASPLDNPPRSLIGCGREPAEVALGLRAQLLKETAVSKAERTI
ncbi:hypothetical protein ABIC02_000013 [Bradyrhizobium sp. RT5a]